MPSQQTLQQHSGDSSMQKVLMWAVVLLVIAIAAFWGLQLARGNSDILCVETTSDMGACAGGSWSAWQTTSTNSDGSIVQQRTYTGTQETLTATLGPNVSMNLHQCHATLGGNPSGTITSTVSACQILQTQVLAANSLPPGPPGQNSSNSANTVLSTSQTQTVGSLVSSTSTSGTMLDYQNWIDARLATSSLAVRPALVHSGDTTNVIWTSDHVKSCVVTSTNADTWSALNSPLNGQVSSKITQQTTYTLTCTTARGNQLISHATVNLIPVFQEL